MPIAPEPRDTHRDRLGEQGLRLVEVWVPDTSSPEFAAEAHRQSLRVARSPYAEEDHAFVDAISEALAEA